MTTLPLHILRDKRLLLVSHEASATGAPILLLNFAEWLMDRCPGLAIHTLILKNGVMFDRWKKIGEVTLAEGLDEPALTRLLQNLSGPAFDLVYFNTIETSHIVRIMHDQTWFGMNCGSVMHIHELEGTIQKYGADSMRKARGLVDMTIAVSEPVQSNLVLRHGFDPGHIHIVHPAGRDFGKHASRKAPRPPSAPITVLGCGEIASRKGTDIFVQVCARVMSWNKTLPVPYDVHFSWLGTDTYSMRPFLQEDIRKLGLESSFTFLGHSDRVEEHFSKADIFFLSSREDPCPLVCLEAASLSLPIVYFDGSGGMSEVLSDRAGIPAPYLNVEKAADALCTLIQHPEQAHALGCAARQRFEGHHTADAVFSKTLDIVLETLQARMKEDEYVRNAEHVREKLLGT